jgi:hypothetical protein
MSSNSAPTTPAGLVLVDGYIPDRPRFELSAILSRWMNQLQQDRQKQAHAFVRDMFKKPQTDPRRIPAVPAEITHHPRGSKA